MDKDLTSFARFDHDHIHSPSVQTCTSSTIKNLDDKPLYPRNTIDMINANFHVTFGIEIECIFAFHESLLRKHFAAANTESKIIKHIPDDIRRELCQVSQHYLDEDARNHDESRRKYMGWGLSTPTAYPPERDNIKFQEHADKHLKKYGYRGYGGEVLHIAQTILPADVEVHDSFNGEDKHSDFSHWHLTHERGLVGADQEGLAQQIDLVVKTKSSGDTTNILEQPTKTKDWDTHPLELVSRVLPYNSTSMDEVQNHLTALQRGQTHFAFATKHCGLHVHVGLPIPHNHPAGTPPPTFTLPTLQHLAYIQVMYETQISKLHPPSRGDGTNIDLKSNTDNFYEEPEPLTDAEYDALEARYNAGEHDVYNTAQPPPFSFTSARQKIFAANMTTKSLSELMGGNDRSRIINWTYITRTNGQPLTIEFRQHAGTLSPTAIDHWTTFVIGLIRLAEHNSRVYNAAPGYDGAGYEYRERSEGGLSVWELMERMELGEGEVRYWRGVVGRWG